MEGKKKTKTNTQAKIKQKQTRRIFNIFMYINNLFSLNTYSMSMNFDSVK
jgi:hypothetical protein